MSTTATTTDPAAPANSRAEAMAQGRQTVCSGACRAKRWRARSVDQQRASASRDEAIRDLLETALKKLGGERP